MPRPSTTLRLSQIDPAQLGADVLEAVRDHVRGLLDVGALLDPHEGYAQIGITVRTLAGYARGDHGLDSDVHEYLVSLIPLLRSPLADGDPVSPVLSGTVDVDELDPESLGDRLGLVCAAALGREALETGRMVRPSWLAALAGVASRSVVRLVASGELDGEQEGGEGQRRPWSVRAASARRWLSTRGVTVGRRK